MQINYTIKDIKDLVGSSYYVRGVEYFGRGYVKSVEFDENKILGSVIGSRQYKQIITVSDNIIEGKCSCPVGYNCKHVVAVLLEALKMNNPNFMQRTSKPISPKLKVVEPQKKLDIKLSYQTKEWLDKFLLLEKKEIAKKKLLYLLDFNQEENSLKVSSVAMNLTKDGNWSGDYQYYNPSNTTRTSPAKFLTDEDVIILRDIANNIYHFSLDEYRKLEGKRGFDILEKIVKSKKCFFKKPSEKPVEFGEKRYCEIAWNLNEKGEQHSFLKTVEKIDGFFVLDNIYYVDFNNNQIGLIETDLDENIAIFMLSCPKIKEDEAGLVKDFIEENINKKFQKKLSLPTVFKEVIAKKIKPKVVLKLHNLNITERYNENVIIPVLNLYFEYDQISIIHDDTTPIITLQQNEKIVKIKRDFQYEREVKNILENFNFKTTRDLRYPYSFYKHIKEEGSIAPYIFLDEKEIQNLLSQTITDKWVSFLTKSILDLKEKGWKIEIADDFLIDIILPDEDWYSDIVKSEANDWFNIDIGIHIAGEKTSLIPILVNLLRRKKDVFHEIQQLKDDENLAVKIEAGKVLLLPVSRIRDIILFLQNLLDADYDDNGIKVSRFSANIIAELAASEAATKLRFFGDKKLIEIGQKLKDFHSIENVEQPKNFTVQLRNYQHEGLNWLQFLKKYNFAGILADDMGLGKTIQTLAHIQYEKENNNLDKPFLIIAPTSVVNNWQQEIKKITPNLNLLVLQGSKRKEELPNFAKQDIILTSYPLLRIDQELLLSVDYHSVILDEAQYIKNSKAKVTLIANQIRAENRLCLTGTPIENHLGELWSIFNFLMPGYLGSEKAFNNIFRNPIEKQNNQEQKAILAKRVKPFLLRRTKEKILHELPQKTEITRYIELTAKQKDLYETIRALTFEEVKNEIEKKGFARSQIKILEALLRLRQICCDPRISNLKNAKKIHDSAKMDYLMEMLTDLIEQKRSILLFSQFVSMLSLIEEECKKRNIKYVKLTGSTKDRQTPIKEFQEGKVQLFLISLKAGGVGLNLTKADTVIHYDPWWNPAVENQATDRAHRIGQQNPVFVYKLITTNTVEEKILNMQSKKKDLADKLFDEKNSNDSKITLADLQDIFQNSTSALN